MDESMIYPEQEADVDAGSGQGASGLERILKSNNPLGELRKALAAGYGLSPDTKVDGGAFRIESLEPTLKNLTFTEQSTTLANDLLAAKKTAESTVEEYSTIDQISEAFTFAEGGLPAQEDDYYSRRFELIKYIGNVGQVTNPFLSTRNLTDPRQAEIKRKMLAIKKKLNVVSYFGDATLVTTEFNGLLAAVNKGITAGIASTDQIIDLRGKRPTLENINGGVQLIENVSGFTGNLRLYLSPHARRQWKDQLLTDKRFFVNGVNNSAPVVGIDAGKIIYDDGEMPYRKDIFLNPRKYPRRNRANNAFIATGSTPPAVPTIETGTGADAGAPAYPFGGTYDYAVVAVNQFGHKSTPSEDSKLQNVTVATDGRMKFVVSDGGSTSGQEATCFEIYRRVYGDTAGALAYRYLFTAPIGAPTAFYDDGTYLPDTGYMFLVEWDTENVLANWQAELKRFLGDKEAKVLVIGQHEAKDRYGLPKKDEHGRIVYEDDDADQVQAKLQQVAQNEYDLILISDSKIDTMMMTPERTEEYLDYIVNRHISDSDMTDREREKAVERLEGRVMGRLKGANDRELKLNLGKEGGVFKSKQIFFDELGIDGLIIDEAHHYKNLFGIKNTRIRGVMGEQDTQRSMRLYMFSKLIRDSHDGKNVFLLTATPTPNNPLEAYNMLQYIAPEEFEKRDIRNMQGFYDMFAKVDTERKLKADNKYKEEQVLGGFKNLPELRQIMFEYTDMRKAEDVGLKVPDEKSEFKVSDMSQVQRRVYDDLHERAEEFFNMSKEEKAESGDHIFSILSDMQKATVSLRLLKETGSGHAPVLTDADIEADGLSPKVRQCIEDTVDVYKQGKKKLIFAEYKGLQQETRDALVKAGIPEDEIYVFNADSTGSSSKRQKVSEDYNNGKYKVVIGNSAMSEGMNFQVATAGIDHLMLAWTPDALVQRNGRGVRQGNTESEVGVKYYLTSGSYDSILHEIISRKKGWQYDLWRGKSDEAENEAGRKFSPEEIRVLLSPDPEAAKMRLADLKKTAIQKEGEELKSRALSNFNQYQNFLIQYKKMKPEEREGDKGKQLASRIETARDLLNRNEQFEQKGLLEGQEPAYVDSDKRIVIPTGQYFTEQEGDWKKSGIYQFTSVDPVNRKVSVRKISEGTDEPKRGGYYSRNEVADVQTIDYKDLREWFQHGMQPVNVPHEEIQNRHLENMKSVKYLSLLDPDVAANNRAKIVEKLLEHDDDAKVPFIDRKDGQIGVTDISSFGIPKKYREWAEGEAKEESKDNYFRKRVEEMKKKQLPLDDLYLPVDPIRWRNDILSHALKDKEEREKRNKSYGGRSSYGRGRKGHYQEPETEFEKLAGQLWGWRWADELPADFEGAKVRPEEPEEEPEKETEEVEA